MTLASRVGALLVTLAILLGASAQSAQPSPERYYGLALENMRALPQPGNASYTVNVRTVGANLIVTANDAHKAQISWQLNGGTDVPTFQAVNRSSDHLTAMLTDKGWAIAASPIFNPTWSGVDDWIRYGAHGRPDDAAPVTPVPYPTPEVLKTLVTVRAMSVAYYNVHDAGSEDCANGDAGYAVGLVARGDASEHPLTGAVIDTKTQQLCTIRLAVRQSGVPSFDAALTLHVGLVGKVSMVTSERIEFNVYMFGMQTRRIVSDVAYTNLAFPEALPEAEFAP